MTTRLLLLVLSLALFTSLSAQEDRESATQEPPAADEHRTLFKGKKRKFEPGFGASYEVLATSIFDETGVMGRFGLYWLQNRRFIFGFGFCNQFTNHDVPPSGTFPLFQRMRWEVNWTCLRLGYVFFPDMPVYVNPMIDVGLGRVDKQIIEPNAFVDGSNVDESRFFVGTAQLNIGFNLTDWLRLYGFGGYRYASGSRTSGVTDEQLGGYVAGGGLTLGLFNPGRFEWEEE